MGNCWCLQAETRKDAASTIYSGRPSWAAMMSGYVVNVKSEGAAPNTNITDDQCDDGTNVVIIIIIIYYYYY